MELCRMYKEYVKISVDARDELYRIFPDQVSGGNTMYIEMLLLADRKGNLNTTVEILMKRWEKTRPQFNRCMEKFKKYGYIDYVIGRKKNGETPINITLHKSKPEGAANG